MDTRTSDGAAFMALAGQFDLRTAPVVYPLALANGALADLRAGAFDGAAVLVPASEEGRQPEPGSGHGR